MRVMLVIRLNGRLSKGFAQTADRELISDPASRRRHFLRLRSTRSGFEEPQRSRSAYRRHRTLMERQRPEPVQRIEVAHCCKTLVA
jgi:hypothetical protein